MAEHDTPPCGPLESVTQGRAFLVTDEENCIVELTAGELPAVPIALSDEKTELRSGSALNPIKLPHLQIQSGGSFINMMIQASDGTWYKYTPVDSCIQKKMVVKDGEFSFVDDLFPVIGCADICEVNACDEYDFLIGLRATELTCEEEEPLPVYEMVLVSKDLVPTCAD